MTINMEYCVVIRTLGTAGDKYQQLLDSILNQTIKPNKILVYLPYDYSQPKETIGFEQIVRCDKGMVMQRSLFFDEVDTDWILFCDDDLSFPPNFVEKLALMQEKENGDCVVADSFNEKRTFCSALLSFIHTYSHPHFGKKWRVKICRSGVFSYSLNWSNDVMLTQSANFRCFLCRKNAYKSIHFQDERWLDSFGYASCDDQLFFYKLYLYGYKVLYGKTAMIHLDAKAGGRHDVSKKMYLQKKLGFVIWYRTIYNINSKGQYEKMLCALAYIWRCFILFLMIGFEILYYKKVNYIWDFFKAQIDGYKYVHSEEYKKIPSYEAYCGLKS